MLEIWKGLSNEIFANLNEVFVSATTDSAMIGSLSTSKACM